MSDIQVISDPSDLRKYRTELPNLYDDADLDVYEFRLLAHYKRVGECTEALDTTAAKCKFSEGKISQARQKLAKKGFIHLQRVAMDAGRYRFIVRVADRWIENFAKYSGLSEKNIQEQLKATSPSPHEGSPSPHEGKNKPIKKLKDSLSRGEFANMTARDAMQVPTLQMYYRATGYFPGSGVWAGVDRFIRENQLTAKQIETASEAWQMRGFKRENVEGILQWARDGVPQNGKGAKYANGKPSNSKGTSPKQPKSDLSPADLAVAERINAKRNAVSV